MRRFGWGIALSLVLGHTASVEASDCQVERGFDRCLDASTLLLQPGASRWLGLPSATVLAPGRVGLALAVQTQYRSLRAELPGPSAEGRSIGLVQRSTDQALLLAAGLRHGFELDFVLTTVVDQRGAGPAALSDQNGPVLPRSAVRDPHVALTRAFPLGPELGVKARVDFGLPFGDSDAFSSSGALTAFPAVAAEWRPSAFAFGAEIGLQLLPSRDLGAARSSSRASFAAGASCIAIERWLELSVEGFVRPALADSSSRWGRALGVRTRLVQSEWLASARTRLDPAETWSLALAAGGGVPLSTESSAGARQGFVAPLSPSARWLVELRYVPR